MSHWSLSQTFLMLCCAVSVAAVVVGRIASPSLEHSGWLGMAASGAVFAGLAMMSRRSRPSECLVEVRTPVERSPKE